MLMMWVEINQLIKLVCLRVQYSIFQFVLCIDTNRVEWMFSAAFSILILIVWRVRTRTCFHVSNMLHLITLCFFVSQFFFSSFSLFSALCIWVGSMDVMSCASRLKSKTAHFDKYHSLHMYVVYALRWMRIRDQLVSIQYQSKLWMRNDGSFFWQTRKAVKTTQNHQVFFVRPPLPEKKSLFFVNQVLFVRWF